jgi:hypothetical protein
MKRECFKEEKLDLGRECFVGVNIQNGSKSLIDTTIYKVHKLQSINKSNSMSEHCLAWLEVGKGKIKLIKLINALKCFVS